MDNKVKLEDMQEYGFKNLMAAVHCSGEHMHKRLVAYVKNGVVDYHVYDHEDLKYKSYNLAVAVGAYNEI